MEVKMTEKRTKIINALKNANQPLTLAQIGESIGEDVKSGTTNTLVSAGLIKKAGKVKVAKVVYVEVETYTIGD